MNIQLPIENEFCYSFQIGKIIFILNQLSIYLPREVKALIIKSTYYGAQILSTIRGITVLCNGIVYVLCQESWKKIELPENIIKIFEGRNEYGPDYALSDKEKIFMCFTSLKLNTEFKKNGKWPISFDDDCYEIDYNTPNYEIDNTISQSIISCDGIDYIVDDDIFHYRTLIESSESRQMFVPVVDPYIIFSKCGACFLYNQYNTTNTKFIKINIPERIIKCDYILILPHVEKILCLTENYYIYICTRNGKFEKLDIDNVTDFVCCDDKYLFLTGNGFVYLYDFNYSICSVRPIKRILYLINIVAIEYDYDNDQAICLDVEGNLRNFSCH